MGGCFGKTIIKDIKVAPTIECLEVEGDNCNGGLLDIRNHCSEDLVLANVVAPVGEYTSLDILQESDGSYSLKVVEHNFSEFEPSQDTALSFTGHLGSQEITFFFTKSARLCE